MVLDCVSLALGVPEVQSSLEEEWVGGVVDLVCGVLRNSECPHVQYMYIYHYMHTHYVWFVLCVYVYMYMYIYHYMHTHV